MSKTIIVSDETYDKIREQIEEEKLASKKKINLTIKNRFTGEVIFESEAKTFKDANLQYADLQYADLHGANLQYADLQYADLHGANLQDANLQYANLQDADLHGANLQYADLQYANLHGADLQYADLQGAKTAYCKVNFSPNEYEQAKQFIEGLKR